MDIKNEIKKRKTFAIISHRMRVKRPNGKALLFGGAIRGGDSERKNLESLQPVTG